ncbi:hypothetical protein [Paraburkholderia bryophila]|uniref:Uncharacterized protein n=1 Tax=Paraburkholderia bryophila TaxID=420952 RepID=A0A7Y9W9S4_9BURK|nr:hypothetical protein [Paraburkholderia bryophila]NYH16857.1 hypothetical protein [Paraburkholderia bryophila]
MSENQPDSSGTANAVPGDDDAEQQVVSLMGRPDAEGHSYAHATLTSADDTRPKETFHDLRPIIPVIFIPGVMGTPLVNKDTGEEAFFAPNLDTVGASIAGLGSIIAGWFRSAASREERFDPLSVAVTPLGPNHRSGRRHRDWG